MVARLSFIFDVDGTLADTESAHRQAFNQAFVEEGLPCQWSEPEYVRLLAVAGGRERLDWYFRQTWPHLGPEIPPLVERVHVTKTRIYAGLVGQGQVPLRPGVMDLLNEARAQGVPLALATTTTPANIDALLRTHLGAGWRDFFSAIADGATAPRKKPDPQVYLQVLAALGRDPGSCLAFEDSYNGLCAARSAGLRTLITPTAFTAQDDFAGALSVLPDLGAIRIRDLEALAGLHG